MKFFITIFTLLLLTISGQAMAFLDFSQDVLEIPNTHEGERYTWVVRDNPSGVESIITRQPSDDGNWLLTLQIPTDETIEEVHLFIVDSKFANFNHIIPHKKNDRQYNFTFDPKDSGKFRVETVIKTDHDWLRLSRDLVVKSSQSKASSAREGEDGLRVLIKIIPSKVYAGHVVTFVFEIEKEGRLVTNLEKIDGFDMHLAAWRTSWFTRFGEFIYSRPVQNFGGSEIAVSMVPKETGHFKIIGQYKLAGELHKIATDLEVYYEPRPNSGGIQNMAPYED